MSEQRSEEQFLSRVVEAGLATQFDDVQQLDVAVYTNIFKVLQGKINALSINGEGILLNGIRIEHLEMQTDDIVLNLLSMIGGQVELNQPINASLQIEMTEADLNQAITTSSVRDKLPSIGLQVKEQSMVLEMLLPGKVVLAENGRVGVHGTIRVIREGSPREIGFKGVLCASHDFPPVALEEFSCTPGQGLSPEILIALMEKIRDLIACPRFQFQSSTFTIQNVQVQKGRITMQVNLCIAQVPGLA